jgi:alpha-tubulin suppressor-like RCC1 family protein
MSFRGAVSGSVLALLLACSGDGPAGPPPGEVEFILTGPNSEIRLPPGVPLTIQLQVLDKDANFLPLPPRTAFTWESSDPAVATVSKNGVVFVQPNAVPGTSTRIKVSYGRAFESVYVVAAAHPVALHFSPPSPTVTPGAKLTLRGLGENPQGELEPRHLIDFTLTAGNGVGNLSPTHPDCGFAGCVAVEPDAVTVTTQSAGVMTVKASADGKTATTDVTVRTVSFTDMVAGTGHTCGHTTDSHLFCWGHEFLSTPIQVSLPQGVSGQLWAGAVETCGIDGSNHAQCWPDSPNPVAEPISTTVAFSQLAPGGTFSCGLDLNGAAWCWGTNGSGELGDGTKTFSVAPVPVSGGLQFQQITTTWTDETGHACALTPAGAAYCWGANFAGQLGNVADPEGCSPYSCSPVPVPAAEGHSFIQIVVGHFHSCGLQADGAAWCWGSPDRTGLGDSPPPANLWTAIPVAGGHVFQSITGGIDHTCGLTTTGQAYCWGLNAEGRTGQVPAGDGVVRSPTLVQGGRTYTRLVAGKVHTCGLAADGLYCWGDNTSGQLGIPGGPLSQPTRVVGQP